MIDPRAAGWSCRLAPARLLRHGDIVTRLLEDHEVERTVLLADGSVDVTFTDGGSCLYPDNDTPMRWRPKVGAAA